MGDDPETGLKLIIQPTFESEEFMTQKMKASAELDGETFPNDVSYGISQCCMVMNCAPLI